MILSSRTSLLEFDLNSPPRNSDQIDSDNSVFSVRGEKSLGRVEDRACLKSITRSDAPMIKKRFGVK
jgi:hypothetical protein